MLVAGILSLLVAFILGLAAYAISQPGALNDALRRTGDAQGSASAEFVFFSIVGIIYLMWATVPLSIGGSKQFDAGKLLMYPITLRKLFAVDFLSELTTLHSIFAVPAVLAVCIGAGLGTGNLTVALITAIPILLFGIALSKWLSTTIGLLVRRKRARGETIVALIGGLVGLTAAVAGQIAPILFKHAESFRTFRWTPPGAAAFLLVGEEANEPIAFITAFLLLSAYAIGLIVVTYWIARRAALGLGGRRRRKAAVMAEETTGYSGWQLPFVSGELSAVIEKEMRYAMRNAQVRMLALMPLILIVVKWVNSRRWSSGRPPASEDFLTYGAGLIATGGVLYVFVMLAGLSCNLFAFEEGGMRTFILAPIDRRKILLGKNIAIALAGLVFSGFILVLDAIVFRDMTGAAILFIALSFIIFSAISSMIGNWLSVQFPKRMRFGKRLNVSGVAGLLLVPMIIVLAMPPLMAVLVGYYTRSLFYEYVALSGLALSSVLLYMLMINFQGRSLARREIDILEAVREPTDE